MRNLIGMMTLGASRASAGSAPAQVAETKPSITLVHVAFTGSSSYAVMVSPPDGVASPIENAARAA